ncbi:hypothetical protein EJB05_00979, partial [Eragrostis curvula]
GRVHAWMANLMTTTTTGLLHIYWVDIGDGGSSIVTFGPSTPSRIHLANPVGMHQVDEGRPASSSDPSPCPYPATCPNLSSLSGKVEQLQSSTGIQHRAIYRSSSSYDSVLYGTIVTLSVHELPSTKKGQDVEATIAVSNFQQGHTGNVNAIHAGWAIEPSFYGDYKTHFSVRWTADGYKSTGCIDLKCDGFVPVNYAPITPGDILQGGSKISIKIFKKKDDGDWWLYFSHDGGNMTAVGFWPKKLFNSLADHANRITWGGYAGSNVREPSPPMGNGQWPGENSATIQDVQFVDSNGNGYVPPPWPAGVHPDMTSSIMGALEVVLKTNDKRQEKNHLTSEQPLNNPQKL